MALRGLVAPRREQEQTHRWTIGIAWFVWIVQITLLCGMTSTARAQTPGSANVPAPPSSASTRAAPPPEMVPIGRPESLLERQFLEAEFGVGALTVPGATFLLPATSVARTRKLTDLTLLLTLRQLFRWHRRFAFGAGIEWGFNPNANEGVTNIEGSSALRTHTRNYFMLTGIARVYPIAEPNFELWVGALGGLVVMSDRYKSSTDRAIAIVGPQATNIGTEGALTGLAVGAAWSLSPSWSIGVFTQEMLWFMPSMPTCVQTLECSTLGGKLFSVELGITASYRLRL